MYDQGYSALIEDLDERGLLDNTLVCNLAEFGRTPQINPAGGRDHWPQCWTVYFAGGGVKGGRVVGSSDDIGAYPAERPATPAEVVATIYKSLGVDLEHRPARPAGPPLPRRRHQRQADHGAVLAMTLLDHEVHEGTNVQPRMAIDNAPSPGICLRGFVASWFGSFFASQLGDGRGAGPTTASATTSSRCSRSSAATAAPATARRRARTGSSSRCAATTTEGDYCASPAQALGRRIVPAGSGARACCC